MKVLIAYYSLTKVTEGLVENVSEKIECDVEEIKDKQNRAGRIKYLTSIIDALRGKKADIKSPEKNPEDYDLVIVGTPVWARTMATPVLSYLDLNKDKIKSVGAIVTCGGNGIEKTIADIESILGKKIVSALTMTREDFNSSYDNKIDKFIEELNLE